MLKSLAYTLVAAAIIFAFTYSSRRNSTESVKEKNDVTELSTPKKNIEKRTEKDAVQEKLFAQEIYRSLKSGNLAQWLSLYPNDVLEQITRIRKEYATNPKLMIEKIKEAVMEKTTSAMQIRSDQFKELKERSTKAGINWQSAVFSDFVFDKNKSQQGEDSVNGDIWLKVNNTEFVIEGVEAIKTTSGYKLQHIVDVKKLDHDE